MAFRANIEIPQLKDEDMVTAYAQLRPSREKGPRIQRELVNGKHIMHNYGHGGAGISLAPSTAYQVVQLSKDLLKPNANVAIIGCGVVGLMTAYRILEYEPKCKVTIYAEQVPTFCSKNNKTLITSEVAPGFWLPYTYNSQDQKQHVKLASYGYNWYKAASQKEQYKDHIRETEFYNLSDDSEDGVLEPSLTQDLKPSLKECYVTLNDKTKVRCTAFRTYTINVQSFLLILKAQLAQKGVKMIQRKITKQNLPSLEECILFNCSGLGSRWLFDDTTLRGWKGHLVQYKNLKPEKYNYLMRANIGNTRMSYYFHPTRIIIGRTKEEEEDREVDMKIVKKIQDIHRLVLQKFNLLDVKPSL